MTKIGNQKEQGYSLNTSWDGEEGMTEEAAEDLHLVAHLRQLGDHVHLSDEEEVDEHYCCIYK